MLEGVAYGLRDSLELLRALGVRAASVGRISGGGARSELWREIVASVLGIPLERTAVDEGAAFGAALLAAFARRLRRRARGGRAACASPAASSRSRRGARRTTRATSASARSTPPSGRFRTDDRRVPLALAAAQALLDEIGELFAILLRISRRVEHDEPMTSTQRLALIEIAVVGPMRLAELAARMDTTAATASRAVDVLEEYRFVMRRADPNDGRAIQIVATAKGRRWSERRRGQLGSRPARRVAGRRRYREAREGDRTSERCAPRDDRA